MSHDFLMQLLLMVLLLMVTAGIVATQDLLAVILLFSMFSLLMALLYLTLHAPDVGITEAAVGAGVSTVIFLAALVHTGRSSEEKSGPRVTAMLVVGLVGAMLLYSTADMPPFASDDSPAQNHVSRYYLEHVQEEIGIPNAVTAILASYRGYDTLGEVCVVFTALVAVSLMLGRKPKARAKEGQDA